jgi:hypothetical protein
MLSASCSILCFNKECICWQKKNFELIEMHGKTITIKKKRLNKLTFFTGLSTYLSHPEVHLFKKFSTFLNTAV